MKKKSAKKLPRFKSDEEMERFLEKTDLSDYMSAETLKPVKFEFTTEFAPKDTTVTMRFPLQLLNRIKVLAAKQHMPYQRLMRAVLENWAISVSK